MTPISAASKCDIVVTKCTPNSLSNPVEIRLKSGGNKPGNLPLLIRKKADIITGQLALAMNVLSDIRTTGGQN